MNISYVFQSQADAVAWAGAIGRRLRGGEIIELVGDLGSGKTTLTRGLVKGTGSTDRVASPTFTLRKEYHVPASSGRQLRTIVHVDLYRLPDAGLMAHELADAMGDPTVCIVIEWASLVADILPDERLKVQLTAIGEQARRIAVQCPSNLGYLLEATI